MPGSTLGRNEKGISFVLPESAEAGMTFEDLEMALIGPDVAMLHLCILQQQLNGIEDLQYKNK